MKMKFNKIVQVLGGILSGIYENREDRTYGNKQYFRQSLQWSHYNLKWIIRAKNDNENKTTAWKKEREFSNMMLRKRSDSLNCSLKNTSFEPISVWKREPCSVKQMSKYPNHKTHENILYSCEEGSYIGREKVEKLKPKYTNTIKIWTTEKYKQTVKQTVGCSRVRGNLRTPNHFHKVWKS